MKAKHQAFARRATLAGFAWMNLIGISSFGQSDPLNSWNQVLSGLPFQVTSMAYGNGTFVGVGGGFRLVSFDGANWNVSATSPSLNPAGVACGDGMFLMFGTNSQNKANYILQSTNGTTWTTIFTSSNTLIAAAYGNNTWVLIGRDEIATATLTSSNWIWSEFQPSFSPSCITFGNGKFVIGAYVGSNCSIFSSSDGITWQYNSTPSTFSGSATNQLPINGIAYGNGFYVVSEIYDNRSNFFGYVFLASTNLVDWPSGEGEDGLSPHLTYLPVTFGGNQFITGLGTFGIFTSSDGNSSDGNTWASQSSLGIINTFTYGQGTFVATDGSGNIYQSGIFVTNQNVSPILLGISTYAGVTINGTAGAVYQIQSTTNINSTWTSLTNFSLPYSPFIWVDTGSPLGGQRFYRSIQLQ